MFIENLNLHLCVMSLKNSEGRAFVPVATYKRDGAIVGQRNGL